MDIYAYMAPKTSCLANYIRQIHYGEKFPSYFEVIFDYGVTHRSPHLRFDLINRVLVFPGSFNLHYCAHLELLRHGFMESGRDSDVSPVPRLYNSLL